MLTLIPKEAYMKKSLFVAVLVVLALALSACGGGDAIVGNWESVYLSDGTSGFKAVGMAKFEFKADNILLADSNGEKAEGTWKKDGEKYILTMDGDDTEATIEKGLLGVTFFGDSKIYFSKDAKNFKDFPEGVVDMDMETEKEEEK